MNVDATVPRSSRLHTIHLLGWMLGCSVVLAFFRTFSRPVTPVFSDLLRELAFGLGYGTAASGLALYLWRWRTGSGPRPTQPGHWLLVFGGAFLCIDVLTAAALRVVLWLSLGHAKPTSLLPYIGQETAALSIGLLIGIVVLFRLQSASPLWMVAVWVHVLSVGLMVVLNVVCLIHFGRGLPGNWPWHARLLAHLACPIVSLPFIWAAEIADRIRRLPRDWLHATGILAATVLCLAEIGFLTYHLIQMWW